MSLKSWFSPRPGLILTLISMHSINSHPWASDLCSGSRVQISPEHQPSVSASPKLRSSSSLETCDSSSCLYSRIPLLHLLIPGRALRVLLDFSRSHHASRPPGARQSSTASPPSILTGDVFIICVSSPPASGQAPFHFCLCSCPASELLAWPQQSGPNCCWSALSEVTHLCGTSPAVQCLRLRAPPQWVRVQSLVGELRSHMLCAPKM